MLLLEGGLAAVWAEDKLAKLNIHNRFRHCSTPSIYPRILGSIILQYLYINPDNLPSWCLSSSMHIQKWSWRQLRFLICWINESLGIMEELSESRLFLHQHCTGTCMLTCTDVFRCLQEWVTGILDMFLLT